MFINKNKTIQSLGSFSRVEYLKFVSFCKKRNNLLPFLSLVAILQKSFPQFSLTKSALFKAIFPDEKYDDLKLRQLFHRLQKELDAFSLINHVSETEDRDYLLARHYKNTQLVKLQAHYKQKLIQRNKELTQIQDFRSALFLETEKMEELEAKQDRTIEPNLQAVHHSLDKLYLVEKLKLACLAINYARINKHEYDLGFLDLLETKIEAQIESEDKLIQALYLTYQFTRYDIESAFESLENVIQQNKFQKNEIADLVFTMSINYCIRKINSLKNAYFPKLLIIYKAQIAAGSCYDKNGFISAVTLRNILAVAIRVEAFEWAEKLILDHYDKLPLLNREDNYNNLLARLYYVKKDYTKTLRLLASSESTDFLNNISSRILQVKCYFDTDDYYSLDNALENFRIYLIRHKNKGHHYINHIHFIKYMKLIIKASVLSKSKRTAFLDKLKAEKQIAEKAWLLQIAS